MIFPLQNCKTAMLKCLGDKEDCQCEALDMYDTACFQNGVYLSWRDNANICRECFYFIPGHVCYLKLLF